MSEGNSSVETVGSHIDTVLSGKPKIEVNFVVNASKNEKAPKFYALVDNGYPFEGTVTSFPVFVKDGVPSAAVPSIYGNAALQAKRITAYRTDDNGEAVLGRLDAAIRIAFYGWQKTHEPQPFVL